MGQRPHCVQTNGQTRHMPPCCFAYAPAHPHLGSSFNFLVLACQPADLRRYAAARPPARACRSSQPMPGARRSAWFPAARVRLLIRARRCAPAHQPAPPRSGACTRRRPPAYAGRVCVRSQSRSASARRLPALSARAAGAMGSRRRGPSAPAMPAGLQQQGTCRSAWPVSRPAPVRRGAASPSLCDGQLAPAQAARPPAASLCCPICARPPAAASARCQLPAGWLWSG